MQQRLQTGDITLTWNVLTVFNTPRPIQLQATPAFTKATGGVAGILLLGIADGIPTPAGTLDGQAAEAETSEPGIGDVLEGLVRWAILNARATLGESDNTLATQDDIALLTQAFVDDNTLSSAVNYAAFLNSFLGLNYRFTITAPAAQNTGSDTREVVFPM